MQRIYKMKGQLQQDVVVGVSATTMWEVYGTIKLPILGAKLFPNVIVDVEQGDGGVGTVLKVTNTNENGEPLASYVKEKYIVVDHEKRIKVAQHIEGKYIDVGFDYFAARLEILERGAEECIIRSTVEYEIDFKCIEDATLPSLKFLGALIAIANLMANYLKHQE